MLTGAKNGAIFKNHILFLKKPWKNDQTGLQSWKNKKKLIFYLKTIKIVKKSKLKKSYNDKKHHKNYIY